MRADAIPGHDKGNGLRARAHDPRIPRVEVDAKAARARKRGEVPVAKVKAQQVAVGGAVESVVHGVSTHVTGLAIGIGEPRRATGQPPQYSRERYAGALNDLARADSVRSEPQYRPHLLSRTHELIMAANAVGMPTMFGPPPGWRN